MGLMNSLRDKTHIILIILVLAFLATIVFEWGMNYLGLRSGQVTELGSVNGKEIDYKEFENQVQLGIEQQKQQTGEDPDEATIQMIRDQVWENFVQQILVQQEIEKLGIRVTDQEILDWVYNKPQTLPDAVKRSFIDSTGQFNMGFYQQALESKAPEAVKFWSQVEDYLKQMLLNQKLQSVITGAVRVSENDVMQKFKDENIIAAFSFVQFSPATIPDNQIQITEDDLKNYYERHKDDYKREESVRMKYVLFPDSPSAEDTTATIKQLKALVKDFKKYAANDTNFRDIVNSNSLNKYSDTAWKKPNELVPEVENFCFTAKIDSVSEVMLSTDGYHLVRLIGEKEGDLTFVNASHILINFGTDTNAAKLKAEQVYQRAKSGEDFIKLAADNSDDPGNKFNGGSLGWFTKGAMVKEFENAVMNGKPGEIVGPVKTQFGFHIIKIKDKQKKLFKVADIKKHVVASTRTKDVARKRAEDFAYVSRKGNFDEEATKLNLKVQEVPPVTRTSFIPGAGQNPSLVKFAFNESRNSISEPFKIQGGYGVYLLTEKIDAGNVRLDEIKETTIRPKVLLEKKLDILKQRATDLKAKITGNEINTIKAADPSINILTADSVSVAKPNPQVGSDFNLLNVVFKMTNGQISEPIRTDNGYYIIQMRNIMQFDNEKYKTQADNIRSQLLMQKKQNITQQWLASLKEHAVIVDNRDKFFK
jgi:peptidyl-prolyl cis-trans isomerase D